MSTPMQSDASVSVEDAYTAARDRAARMTEALILAEARIIALAKERDGLMHQLVIADEDHWRPTSEGPPEFVCPHRPDTASHDAEWATCPGCKGTGNRAHRKVCKGVKDGADSDPIGYTTAIGQAD